MFCHLWNQIDMFEISCRELSFRLDSASFVICVLHTCPVAGLNIWHDRNSVFLHPAVLNLCCDAGQHGFSQRIFPSRSTKWICWWASLLLLPRDPSLSLFVFFGWKMLWIGTNQSLFASDLPQVHIDQINTWQHRWELSIWYFWFEVACHSGV